MKKFLTSAGAVSALALTLGAALPANAAIETFATISATTSDNLYFKNASTTGASSNATLYAISSPTSKVPGSVGVKFSFIDEGATLDTAVTGVNAILSFSAATSTAADSVGGYLIQPGLTGTFSIVSTTAIVVGHTTYAAGSDLLSASFDGAGLAGPKNSTSGGLDASNENTGSTLTYMSDFVSFEPAATLDASFSLTSITPALAVKAPGDALKTFKADAGGSFSADPLPKVLAAPEPAAWAMMLVGFGGVGAMVRRRKTAALSA